MRYFAPLFLKVDIYKMSDTYVNQVTLDCLLNKELYNSHLRSKKNQEINKEERRFYKKRIFNLFKEIITGNDPEDLLPDVKYAYNNFINASIHYLKTKDNNDIIQKEYNDFIPECSNIIEDSSLNYVDADKLLMRQIKIDAPTLDKYVKRTSNKKPQQIILPKQKEINLNDPELKIKGLNKNK